MTQARLWSRVHGSVHGSSGQKAIRKFNVVGVRKNNNSGQRRRKSGGGLASRPREGDFHASPSPRWGTNGRFLFFRRHVVVLLCGWDVAAPRGRRTPSGARESQLFWGGVITKIFSKILKNATTTTLAYYIIRIYYIIIRIYPVVVY